MPEPAWKTVERRVCKFLGSNRRGAGTSEEGEGKSDCKDACLYNVEISRRKQVGLTLIRENISRAEKGAAAEQIPIAVSLLPNMRTEDAVVSMRLEQLRDLLGT